MNQRTAIAVVTGLFLVLSSTDSATAAEKGSRAASSLAEIELILVQVHPDDIALPEYNGAPQDLQALRRYIIDLASDLYAVDSQVFNSASLLSTSILRDLVHKTNSRLPYKRDIARVTLEFGPARDDVAAMWRYPARGRCGHMSYTLYHVYRSMGYETNRLSSVNGELPHERANNVFTRSHSLTEVLVDDLGKFIVQDPTFNYVIADDQGALLDFLEARMRIARGEAVSFETAGFAYRFMKGNEILEDLPIERATFIVENYFGVLRSRVSSRGERETVRELSGLLEHLTPDVGSREAGGPVLEECHSQRFNPAQCRKTTPDRTIGIELFTKEGVSDEFFLVNSDSGPQVCHYSSRKCLAGTFDAVVARIIYSPDLSDRELFLPLLNPSRFLLGENVILEWVP